MFLVKFTCYLNNLLREVTHNSIERILVLGVQSEGHNLPSFQLSLSGAHTSFPNLVMATTPLNLLLYPVYQNMPL